METERSVDHPFRSSVIGDTYTIRVHLPDSYHVTTREYPVLYVLDADRCFGLASDTSDWLAWAKETPESIVVGPAYGGSLDAWWQKRSRDYTPTKDHAKTWGEWPMAGGGKAFQRFLEQELFPFVEGNYRVLPGDRTMLGLSFGGLFGAYTLFTEPTLFQRYILIAPALLWDQRRVWEFEATYRSKSSRLPAVVFTAVGDHDDPSILDPWKEMNSLVQVHPYDGLRWHSHVFPDETHISVLPASLSRGLRVVYAR